VTHVGGARRCRPGPVVMGRRVRSRIGGASVRLGGRRRGGRWLLAGALWEHRGRAGEWKAAAREWSTNYTSTSVGIPFFFSFALPGGAARCRGTQINYLIWFTEVTQAHFTGSSFSSSIQRGTVLTTEAEQSKAAGESEVKLSKQADTAVGWLRLAVVTMSRRCRRRGR
jgi:hypothetical protein